MRHNCSFSLNRPLNNNEKVGRSHAVLELPSNKEVVVRERPSDKHSKKFTFDSVFGPTSKQVYKDTVFLVHFTETYTLNIYFEKCLQLEEIMLCLKFIDRCI